jgi:hypothetical protein
MLLRVVNHARRAWTTRRKLMNRIRMTISALALAVVAVTATAGAVPWGGDDAVVADRWCC